MTFMFYLVSKPTSLGVKGTLLSQGETVSLKIPSVKGLDSIFNLIKIF